MPKFKLEDMASAVLHGAEAFVAPKPEADEPAVAEGISPEDAERLLLRPLETKLHSVEGLKELKSTAFPGGGDFILKFEAGFDADRALRDVRDRIDQAKPDLPAEADEPSVRAGPEPVRR